MRKLITVGFFAVLLIVVGIVYSLTAGREKLVSDVLPTPTPLFPTTEQFITGSPDTNALLMGGSSYTHPQGLYTFLYPNDYVLDTQDSQYIRVYKQGATQRGQTEMYDGVIVVFETIDLQGKSLEEVVDERIVAATADGTSEIVQPKKPTTLNTYSGFTYEIRGLGTSTHLILQKHALSTEAVDVTFLVADPEQVGYQDEVDAILSTLELRE